MAPQTGVQLCSCVLTVTSIPPAETGTNVQVSYEGAFVLATIVVAALAGATDAGKLAILGLDDADGGLSWEGREPATTAKADVVGIQVGPNFPSWLAQAKGAAEPPFVTRLTGGYLDLSDAAQYQANPLAIKLGQGVLPGFPWTIRYMIRIREGATGTLNLRAWVDASTDSQFTGGYPAESATARVTIAKGGVVPSLDPPTSVAVGGGVTPGSLLISWEWPSLGDHRELGVIVEAAGPEGGFYASTTPGEFSVVARLPPGSAAWQEYNLPIGQRRFYRVRRDAATTTGTPSAIVSATPTVVPTTTATPVVPTASAASYQSLLLIFSTAVQSNIAYWSVQREINSSGDWFEVGRTSPYPFAWVDESAAPGTEYRYRIEAINYAGASVALGFASDPVGIPSLPVGVALFGGSMAPGYRYSTLVVNGGMLFLSDGDRGWFFDGKRQVPRGLLPLLEAGVLTDAMEAGGLTGTFVAYAALIRYPNTRSLPSPISNAITITNEKLTLTMPSTDSKVRLRDVGYDLLGATIDAADAWEFYLAETSGVSGIAGQAYLVGTYPLTTLAVTTPAGLVTADLANDTRRPMEIGGQSSVGAACAFGALKDGHVYYGGEAEFRPMTGASLTFTDGDDHVESTDYAFTTALIGKIVVLGGVPTQWQVTDVISTTELVIGATDPALAAVGWQGGTGDRFDFAFLPNPPSVYVSPIFEALGTNFSPETQLPATTLQAEFDATDMQPINSLSASRDALIVGKRKKWFGLRGGGTPDTADQSLDADGNLVPGGNGDGFASTASPFAITRQRGIIASGTRCPGPGGTEIYLDSDGPCLVSASGVQPLGPTIGLVRLFQETFETGNLSRAQACYLPDQQLYIVSGIDAKGRRGGRDGFVYSILAGFAIRYRWAARVTKLHACERDDGTFQCLFGDERGAIGVALALGTSSDDIDLTGRSDPWESERPVITQILVGIVNGQMSDWGRGELAIETVVPTLRSFPGDTASGCRVDIEAVPRNGAGLGGIEEFSSDSGFTFTTLDGSPRFHPDVIKRSQSLRTLVTVAPLNGERVEIGTIDVVTVNFPRSAEQS